MEQLIAEVTRGEIWSPPPGRTTGFTDRAAARLGAKFRPALRLPRFVEPPRSNGRYDVLFVAVQRPSDLVALSTLGDWRRFADRAVCYIEEVWAAEVESLRRVLGLVADFDQRFVTAANTIPALQRVTASSWHFLAFAVDAQLFAPIGPDSDRPIAVANIGRRSPITHGALLDWARRSDHLYYFDSFSPLKVKDPSEHRWMLASLMKRTEVAISNRGIGFDPGRTKQQEELAFRYFEAGAAGAVMVGQPPDTPVFEELFDWPDALIEAPFDCPSIGELVDDLLADEARLRTIHRRNVAECLARHDHVHRWIQICELLGIEPGARAFARVEALEKLAERWRTDGTAAAS